MSAAPSNVIPFALPTGPLYEIKDHLTALFDSLDLCETEERRAECKAEIAAYLEAEVRKVDGIGDYLRHCEVQAEYAGAEVARLKKRKATWERRYEGVQQYVLGIMTRLNLPKLEGRTSTLTVQACPVSVDWTDEAAVPAAYKTVTVTLPGEEWLWLLEIPGIGQCVKKVETTASKTLAKEALEAKVEVPGARLVTDKKTVVLR